MKPRNYFAVHAHFRKGGAHVKTNKAQRKSAKQTLRAELRAG
jgi:hypothetical protein